MSNESDDVLASRHATPKQSPGFLLWCVSTSWRSSIEKTLRSFSLTHPQFVVLASIGWASKAGGSVTQIQLSRATGLDPNTMSQVIKGLETRELVIRTRSKDGRAKDVALTEPGLRLVQKALPTVEEADAKFFNLTPQNLEQLLLLLHELSCQGS